MKALVIARREFLGTRNLWIAAPLLGLFAVGLPLLRGLTGQPAEDLRVVTAVGIGFGLCAVLGLILGAGLFAGDLAQKRAGFFLSRPVGSASLYFGKLLGSLLLVFLAGALVPAPLLLLRPAMLGQAWALPLGLLLTALTGLLVGHAGAIILRARSPWLLLDLVTLGGFGALAWVVQSALMEAGAVPAFFWSGSTLFAGTLVVLLLAGLLQVARGRGDLRAGHRVLSLSLAAGLLPLATGVGLFARRVLQVKPTNLQQASVDATQPGGTWLLVRGHSMGFGDQQFLFLLDTDSGRFLPVADRGKFSPDGRRFIWALTNREKGQPAQINVTELSTNLPTTRDSGASIVGYANLIAVSTDGSQMLLTNWSWRGESWTEWWDLVQGRRIDRLPLALGGHAWFLGTDKVRYLSSSASHLQLSAWQLGSTEPRELWRHELDSSVEHFSNTSPGLDRLFILNSNPGNKVPWRSIELMDLQTGCVLASFEAGSNERLLRPLFLSTGDLLVALVRPGLLDLSWCNGLGELKGRCAVQLPVVTDKDHFRVNIVGEVAPRKVLVQWSEDRWLSTNRIVVDLENGAIQPSQDGVRGTWSWQYPDPGGLWSRLHQSKDRALHVRQPDGSLKRLTAPD